MEFIAQFDQSALEALFAIRDPFVVQIMIWISELGSALTIAGLTSIVALILILKRHYAYAAGIMISVAASSIMVFLAKDLVERARPDRVFQAYLESGFSFPSGHATMSLAFYGFLTWLAWRFIPSKRWRLTVLAIAILVIGAIGFSRMYLGIHYASDVAGGFLIGAAFVWIAAITAQKTRALFTDRFTDRSK